MTDASLMRKEALDQAIQLARLRGIPAHAAEVTLDAELFYQFLKKREGKSK